MNDINVMRKMLEQIKAEGSIDFTTLRLQFYNLCKGSADIFADYLAFLSEVGAIRLNHEARTVEKI